MKFEVMQLVIPSIVTMIGWFIAAWWAIKQVNVAHNRNAELQQQLMRDSHQRELAKELIEVYKCIARSGDALAQAISSFSLNYGFQVNGIIEGVHITASDLIPKVNEAYNSLSQEVTRLDMWLKVCEGHLPDTALLNEAIREYRGIFSIPYEEDESERVRWSGYQGLLVACHDGIKLNPEAVTDASGELVVSLNGILEKFSEGTAVINKELVTV